jgi:hypothetical protein
MDLEQVHTLAKGLALAAVMPDSLRGKPWDIVAMVLYGQDLGLSPMQAIQGIYVVKGKPQMSAQTWIALTRRAGHRLSVAEHTARTCTVEILRGDTGEKHAETFTIEDAETARLTGKDSMYSKYPKRMLLARAVSNCCRFICPEIALGFYAEGDEFTDDTNVVAEQVQADQDITDAEIVEPEKAAEQVAELAKEFDFTQSTEPDAEPEPVTEALPLPPAEYECSTCEVVGDHYEDECAKAATPS